MSNKNVTYQVWAQAIDQTYDKIVGACLLNVKRQVWELAQSSADERLDSPKNDQVWQQVNKQIWYPIWESVSRHVRDQIRNKLNEQAAGKVSPYEDTLNTFIPHL